MSIIGYDRDRIRDEFLNCTRGAIARTTANLANVHTSGSIRPFHSALLTREALIWSQFERSFSTSFGQGAMERVSKIVAETYGATEANLQEPTIITIDSGISSAISTNIQNCRNRHAHQRGNWIVDQAQVSQAPLTGITEDIRVISDLWFRRSGFDNYVSIKTVKPNIDQTAQAKADLLLLSMLPNTNVYFGLYYNPWGEPSSNYRPGAAAKIFDFMNDPIVLIGQNYWDTIGARGAYQSIMEIADEARQESQALVSDFARMHGIA